MVKILELNSDLFTSLPVRRERPCTSMLSFLQYLILPYPVLCYDVYANDDDDVMPTMTATSTTTGGRVILRGGHAEAPPNPPEGSQVPPLRQGQGCEKLHDVFPGELSLRPRGPNLLEIGSIRYTPHVPISLSLCVARLPPPVGYILPQYPYHCSS